MELRDSRLIGADSLVVWGALLDAEVLRACVPGCERMTGSAAEGFEAVVVQKVGPVSARFTGVVTLSDMVEGRSLRITGEGKGGPAGFAKGGADVTLTPSEGGTLLEYAVTASVGGKIAQLGSRIIDGFAKKMADEFFTRFQAAVEAPPAGSGAAAAAAGGGAGGAGSGEGPEDGGPEGGEGRKKGWFRRLMG